MKEYIIAFECPVTESSERIAYQVQQKFVGELIRCKDCKRWETDDGMFKDIDERQWHHCPHIGIDTEEYFFCSEAERKEE